jgi:hypothetical protein
MNHVPFLRRKAASRRLPRGRRTRRVRRCPRTTLRVGFAGLLGAAAAALSLLAAPRAANAADPVVLGAESIQQVVDNIRLWLVGILAAWATLCLTVGFIRYTSGEPGEVEKGKVALRSAAIGYAGALLAPLLVTIVAGWVA